jgi:hypothetical protein
MDIPLHEFSAIGEGLVRNGVLIHDIDLFQRKTLGLYKKKGDSSGDNRCVHRAYLRDTEVSE